MTQDLQKADIRSRIFQFETEMRKCDTAIIGDSDVCPLKHSFAEGVYVREIFIPAGMLIVGKIHRHSHPNFLMSGEVSVMTESGGVQRLKAPLSMISEAGTKRLVYAHTDTTWITVHVTNDRDLAKIEEQVIAPSYEELDKELEQDASKMLELIESEAL